MRSYVSGIRDQINALGSVQVMHGQLDETADTEIFLRLFHKKTIFTWALHLRDMKDNNIKPQFFYFSSITKQRKTSGAVPEDGIYVHNNGRGYVEIKFVAEL